MWQRFLAVAAIASLVAAGLLASRSPAEEGQATPRKPPEAVKWDLDKLSQEPIKLIKATPVPQKGQVQFLLEFTRPPSPSELFDWEQHGGPVMFRFLDEDKVVLGSVKPRWEGELVPKKGWRMRLVLSMPDERILAATRSVTAE